MSGPKPNEELEAVRKRLIGRWHKVRSLECADAYPEELEFLDRPRFAGTKGPNQRFIIWDVGGYEVVGKNRLRIDTASDEQVIYEFQLAGDLLRFVDRDGCQFEYKRIRSLSGSVQESDVHNSHNDSGAVRDQYDEHFDQRTTE